MTMAKVRRIWQGNWMQGMYIQLPAARSVCGECLGGEGEEERESCVCMCMCVIVECYLRREEKVEVKINEK